MNTYNDELSETTPYSNLIESEVRTETETNNNTDSMVENVSTSNFESESSTIFILDNETSKLLSYKWDYDIFNIIPVSVKANVYTKEEFLNKFIPEKWQEIISKADYWEKTFTYVYSVNGYTIIKYYNKEIGDLVGSLEGPDHYLIMNNETFFYFYPVDYCQSPWFYISDDSLYVFEQCKGLVQHYSLTQYDINTGEIVEQITAYFDWAEIENIYRLGYDYFEDNKDSIYNGDCIYFSVPYINNISEFEKYMLSISDTWYD